MREGKLMEALPDFLRIYHKGKDRAVSLWEIVTFGHRRIRGSKYSVLLHCQSDTLSDAVNILRRRYPIGSNAFGYYWIVTKEDAQDTLDYLERPAKARLKTAKYLRQSCKKLWNMEL